LILSKQDWLQQCEFIHQTGKLDHGLFAQEYQQTTVPVEVTEYIHDMVACYLWADVVIARAGASTIAELAKAGKPSILIPLPLADGHQINNALSLSEKNAAIVLLQKDLTINTLGESLKALKEDLEKRKQLHSNIQQFYAPKAAQKIAEKILEELF
jgi:UDP-N-acetylglucosamine--N-acetylmuramyl-(pentapeptide) pyrophosphoryl-undecaprenol N-acetylglucosamine transferase